MRFITVVIFLVSFGAARAEWLKKGTIAYKTMGGEAVLQFDDSARIYPYEPAMGQWRMVLWVGFIDTTQLAPGNMVPKGARLKEWVDFTYKTTTLKEFPLPMFNDLNSLNYRWMKKFALYLYVHDTCIMDESRMEKRLERIISKPLKSGMDLLDKFKTDFGFISTPLVDDFTLHFVHDERSPEGYNDFRLLFFSDSTGDVIAVAKDDYRPMKIKSVSEAPLDRKLIVYYLKKMPEERRKTMEKAFLESYGLRD